MSGTTPAVDLSVVIPVYFNEGCLWKTTEDLIRDVFEANPELTPEIVFIDDGSRDRSLEELHEIQAKYPSLVRIIALTRNFGQPAARLAGLRHARGATIISMSADGQDPATVVAEMLRLQRETGKHVVIGRRVGRDESLYRVWTSAIFYRLMRRLSFSSMPTGGFDLVLLSRRVLDVILKNQDAQPFFQGQILWSGYEPVFLDYRRRARDVGRSRWTFGKKITLLLDAVLSYSFVPIRLISLIGFLFACGGFVSAIALVVRWLVWGTEVAGWTTIVVLLLVVGGMQSLMMGIIGEYVWRALAQSRGRDLYVIRDVYEAASLKVPPAGARGQQAVAPPGD